MDSSEPYMVTVVMDGCAVSPAVVSKYDKLRSYRERCAAADPEWWTRFNNTNRRCRMDRHRRQRAEQGLPNYPARGRPRKNPPPSTE